MRRSGERRRAASGAAVRHPTPYYRVHVPCEDYVAQLESHLPWPMHGAMRPRVRRLSSRANTPRVSRESPEFHPKRGAHRYMRSPTHQDTMHDTAARARALHLLKVHPCAGRSIDPSGAQKLSVPYHHLGVRALHVM